MKSISIIANLLAGSSKAKNILASMQDACNRRGIDFNVYISKYPGHISKLVREVSEKNIKSNHRIVILGGDGSLNQAVEGLMFSDSRIPIAYFPAGTGNDFSRSLNLCTDVDKFVNHLHQTKEEALEILSCYDHITDKQFCALNGLGIGFDAKVASLTNHNASKQLLNKLYLGKFSYLLNVISAYKKREYFDALISVDGTKANHFKDLFFITSMKNQYFGGGIKIDPFAKKNSNQMSLIIAKEIETKDIFRLLPHILKTGKHFEKTEKLQRLSCQKLRIEVNSKNILQRDGELFSFNRMDLEISIATYPFYLLYHQ